MDLFIFSRRAIYSYYYLGTVAKFSPAGTLLYSATLNDSIIGLGADASGNVYYSGGNNYYSCQVTKLNSSISAVVWSTSPPSCSSAGSPFVVDGPGNVYSIAFSGRTTPGALMGRSPGGGFYAFKLGASGTTIASFPSSISFYNSPGNSYYSSGNVYFYTVGNPLPVSLAATTFGSNASWVNLYSYCCTNFLNPIDSSSLFSLNYYSYPTNLPAGTYNSTLFVTAPGADNSPASVPISLTVTNSPAIYASPSALLFSFPSYGASGGVLSNSFSINQVNGTYSSYSVTSQSSGWLSFTDYGYGYVYVYATNNNLSVGVYDGSITITVPGRLGSPVVVPVKMIVSANTLSVNPSSLSFVRPVGSTGTTSQSFSVATSASGSYSYKATANSSGWLSVVAPTGIPPEVDVVSVNSTGLAAGTYNGNVTLTPSDGTTPLVIPVVMTVVLPKTISVTPASPAFNIVKGAATSQTIPLQFTADSDVYYTLTSNSSWLSLSTYSGTGNSTVTLTASPGNLTLGQYFGTITVFSPTASNTPIYLNVTMNLTAPPPPRTLIVKPASLAFAWQTGSPAPAAQTVNGILDPAGGNVTAIASTSWLVVTPSSNGADFKVTINTSGLTPGIYNGAVIVSGDGAGNKSVPVTLTVTEPPQFLPGSASLTFNYRLGNPAPPPQVLYMSARGSHFSFTATANSDAGWLSIDQSSGKTPANVNVSVNPAALAKIGAYRGTLVFASPDAANSPFMVPVTLNVTNAPGFVLSTDTITANWLPGASAPVAQTIHIGGDNGLNFTATTSGGPWFAVSPASGRTPADLKLQFFPASLASGAYEGLVSIASPDAPPTQINVRMIVGSIAPVVSANGIVNGASFTAGPVAPGSMAAVFGNFPASGSASATGYPLPASLAGLSVKVNGVTAPLFYSSPNQLDVQIPPSIQPGTARLVVSAGGVDSAPAGFAVTPAAPGIFADAANHGAIRNQDGTLNATSKPAAAGTVMVAYFTGIGAVDRDMAAGEAAPLDKLVSATLPVTATLGGKPCEISFSGLAPGFAGLAQINLRVPPGLKAGDQELVLTIGGITSPSVFVTVN